MGERKTGISNFSFVRFFCPNGYEEIARGVLGELKITVNPQTQQDQKITSTGEVLNGIMIDFACPTEKLAEATETLKSAGIAGYDNLTRINSLPLKPHLLQNRFSSQ